MISTIKAKLAIEIITGTSNSNLSPDEEISKIIAQSKSKTIRSIKKNKEPIDVEISVKHDKSGITILDTSLDIVGFKVCLIDACLDREFSYSRFAVHSGLSKNSSESRTMDTIYGITIACNLISLDVPLALKRRILGKVGVLVLWLGTATDNRYRTSNYALVPHIFKMMPEEDEIWNTLLKLL